MSLSPNQEPLARHDTTLTEAEVTAAADDSTEDGDEAPFDPRFHTQPYRIGGGTVETVNLSGEPL